MKQRSAAIADAKHTGKALDACSVCTHFFIPMFTSPQEKEAKKQRTAAIADAKRMGKALDACNLCITSSRRPRHLTLAIGQASYLMLPAKCDAGPIVWKFGGFDRKGEMRLLHIGGRGICRSLSARRRT